MKIELKDITISSFLNIAEEQTVVFDGPGIYSVVGENKDDGGSNGSGKSSFLRALTVLTQGSKYIDVTNKEIKNRTLGLPARISGNLLVNNKPVSINRTIGGKFSVQYDGLDIDGKSDEIQDKLIQLIGISPEHYIHLTHKMQEEFGGFLLMKDSEKKDFLGAFFDTAKIDKINDDNSSKLSSLTKQLSEEMSKFSSLNGSVSVLRLDVDSLIQKVQAYTSPERIESLARLTSDLNSKMSYLEHLKMQNVDSLLVTNKEYCDYTSQLEVATKEYQDSSIIASENSAVMANKLSSLRINLQEITSKQQTVPSEYTQKLNEIQQQIDANTQISLKINTIMANVTSDDKKIQDLTKKINELKHDSCAMCGQSINLDIFNGIKSKFNEELNSQISSVQRLNEKKAELASNIIDPLVLINAKKATEDSIISYKSSFNRESIESEIKMIQSQLHSSTLSLSSLEHKVSMIRSNMMSIRQQTESMLIMSIKQTENEINTLNMQIKMMNSEAEQANLLLSSTQKKYNDYSAQLRSIEVRLADINQQIKVRSKVSDILSRNGFVGYIFDTVLEEINQEVNENIKQITVISRLSMYFSPDQVAKTTGNVSKSINYKIFDKNEEVSFATLSGSEKESLLIAVDAAVDTVLCRRLGVDINYKILDEQFGWVDGVHKEPILDFIKNKYYDKIVLIVDHGSELNASIDKKITVTKQNGVATISCHSLT